MVFKMKTGQADTMSSMPEMVDSVNALILADRKVTIADISEQLMTLLFHPSNSRPHTPARTLKIIFPLSAGAVIRRQFPCRGVRPCLNDTEPFQSKTFEEYEVPLYCYYSQVHSDP